MMSVWTSPCRVSTAYPSELRHPKPYRPLHASMHTSLQVPFVTFWCHGYCNTFKLEQSQSQVPYINLIYKPNTLTRSIWSLICSRCRTSWRHGGVGGGGVHITKVSMRTFRPPSGACNPFFRDPIGFKEKLGVVDSGPCFLGV